MDYIDIGARIKEARKATGMTQEQLAEAAELSVGYIHQLECNLKGARIVTLLRIADALSVSPAQLLANKQNDGEAILALFNDCSTEEGQILYDVTRTLKQSLREHWRA